MGTEIQGYVFAFLFFGALGLLSFGFWRFLSALRSEDAEVRKEAKRKAFFGLRGLVSAIAAIVLVAAVYSEVDLRIGDNGRFATLKGRTIELNPSHVKFQIPQDWLEWDSQFHNNLHLTHRQLRSVRVGHGEWDSEYGSVVNAALPFDECAVHVGGEGWGWSSVSFGDLQVRAYIATRPIDQILAAITTDGFRTAQRIAERQGGWAGTKPSLSTSTYGKWQRVEITYPLWYGDYGGSAPINFYIRDIGQYRLALVFMGWGAQDERASILDSVDIPEAGATSVNR
jgi:hypothetical protein